MTIRIYVADLAAYNNGILHGAWIDCEGKDADDLQKEVDAMLAKSPLGDAAEEFAIHDFEGFPRNVIGEYTSIDDVAEIVEAIEEHGEVFTVALSYSADVAEALEMVERYAGHYDSKEHWAEDFLESTGALQEIPENLRLYFDFERYARDAELRGDIDFLQADDGGYHVFHSH